MPTDLLVQARQHGVAGPLSAPAQGWSRLSVIRAHGPDAAEWLQSQTTNDVAALQPGQSQLNARVTRTGHLVAVFLLVCHAPGDFWLVLPTEDAERLHQDLDAFLFADQVQLDPVDIPAWAAISGPQTCAVCATLDLPQLAEQGVVLVQDGVTWIRQAFTGDDGLLVAGPDTAVQQVLDAAEQAGLTRLDAAELSPVIDALRQEAGLIRPGVDLQRKRLLPETGLEQLAVSYTKGCYLGQEVIARVRTYGSVPKALRALVLDGDTLDGLPEIGEPVVLDDGKKAGQAVSRAWSPAEQSPVLLAFLGRNHRTPGATLTLRTPGGLREARVALLPLHRTPDRAERVAALYDRGVRAFAQGNADAALSHLEAALRLDPEHLDAYEAIGVILARTERFHEAIDVFRRLEEVAPDEPLVNTNLSLYYMKIGDKETAETQASIAARKSMSKGSGKSAAQLATEADEARRADAARKERMFRQVLDFDPVDPIALFGLGSSLSILGRYDEAAEILERAREADGKNAAVYLTWGKALERLGRDDEAVRVYREGMEVASRRGDLMPLREMESRVLLLG